MTAINSIVLVIIGVAAYIMIVDENVIIYLSLLFKLFKINVERFFWMIKYHPNNFITTWIQNRKYDKMAKELEEEFKNK